MPGQEEEEKVFKEVKKRQLRNRPNNLEQNVIGRVEKKRAASKS